MSNLTDYKNIWVFIETECGKPKNVGYELLNVAKPLAETKGCELVAVVIGNNIENVAKDAICYGADSAIIVDREEYEMYTTDAFAKALTALVEKYKPETLMIGATNNGRDLGPRVSCRLKTGLTADCTGIDIDEETGNVAWTRPTFGGNLMATIMCPDNRPQMGTVRPGVFKKGAYDENRTGEIVKEDIAVAPEDPVAAAKIICDFAKENKALVVKAGVLDGKVIDDAAIKALAELPPKEVLVAKMLGSMNAPISGFVNVLQGTIRKVVYALDAIRKQKESA